MRKHSPNWVRSRSHPRIRLSPRFRRPRPTWRQGTPRPVIQIYDVDTIQSTANATAAIAIA